MKKKVTKSTKRADKVTESKLDQLRLLAKECNDALGADGKVYLGSDHPTYDRIPVGILAIDTITGGGLPRASLTELFGEESSGKTLLTLMAVAAAQRRGLAAVWVKGEDFDSKWAARNGVDLDRLVMVEASTGDAALETAVTILESGLADLMVFDSYQALGTTREAEGGVDSEAYAGGGAPQLWGRVMRRAYAAFNSRKASTALVGISQVRDQIGGFSPNGKPDPIPTQIRALKHWKAISILCKRGEPRYEDPKSEKRRIVSREFHLKCKKNKTAPPDRVSSYWYNFRSTEGVARGVDRAEEAMRMGKVYGLLKQSGSWLEGYGLRAQGEAAFLAKLRSETSTVTELYTDVMDVVSNEVVE